MWRMSWKATVLLSIIIPISLLATFRLAGILPEPPTPETITTDAVSWNMSRPTQTIVIDMSVNNSYAREAVLVGFCLYIAGYRENFPTLPYGDLDSVDKFVFADVSIKQGYIHSITVRLSRSNDNSFLNIIDDPDRTKLSNLTKKETWNNIYSSEVLFEATAVNKPAECSLMFTVSWMFNDQNNENHFVTVTLETIFFDGTIYRKLVIPIQFGVLVS